jgi:hypothetical protein
MTVQTGANESGFIRGKDRYGLDGASSSFLGVAMGTMITPSPYWWVTGFFLVAGSLLGLAAFIAHRRAKAEPAAMPGLGIVG